MWRRRMRGRPSETSGAPSTRRPSRSWTATSSPGCWVPARYPCRPARCGAARLGRDVTSPDQQRALARGPASPEPEAVQSRPMEHWDLRAREVAPHHPEVLRSDDGVLRTVVIQLPSGERLREHETHEPTWLVGIDGEIESGQD